MNYRTIRSGGRVVPHPGRNAAKQGRDSGNSANGKGMSRHPEFSGGCGLCGGVRPAEDGPRINAFRESPVLAPLPGTDRRVARRPNSPSTADRSLDGRARWGYPSDQERTKPRQRTRNPQGSRQCGAGHPGVPVPRIDGRRGGRLSCCAQDAPMVENRVLLAPPGSRITVSQAKSNVDC